MQEITESALGIIAADIEKMLIEQREGIAYAYNKIPDGIKLSISVSLDPTNKGMSTEYQLSYPLEPKKEPAQKQAVKYKRIINEDQQELFENLESVTATHDGKTEVIYKRT